jgi:long-chain acyl-CoA synthetase
VNLASVIDGHPDQAVALVCGPDTMTYGELRARVAEARGGLAALAVGPGDRVALIARNEPGFVVGYLAILGVGAVAVPLNPGSPAPELERELAAVEPEQVLAGAGCETVVANARPIASLAGGPPVPMVDRDASDLAVLIFTAGTGATPKPAMLTHGSLLANLDQMQRHPGRTVSAEDVTLGVLPLFHIFGLNVVLGLSLLAGSPVVVIDEFHAAQTLAAIAKHHVTLVAGAPTMYAALAAVPDADGEAMASVRLAVSGAAALSAEIAAAFQRRFGIPLREGYGLTEASPVVTSSVLDAPPKPGSVGVPIPGVEVRLVDDEGEDALLGDPGEVWVRGPNVFAGYWNDPEATAAALTPDGWLRTGDIGVAGDDGELYLVDRSKDLIIVSGFNVFPTEVEEVLLQHPAVAETAVVGVRHAYSGEVVRAYVVLAPGETASEAELIEHCARRLARYKCPTEIIFAPALPHGLTGKLLRRALRAAPG